MANEIQHQLSRLSKQAIKLLIESIGLRRKYRDVLLYKYVHEMSNYDIGIHMGYTSDSVANLLCKARKQLQQIFQRERDLLPKEIQPYIDLLKSED